MPDTQVNNWPKFVLMLTGLIGCFVAFVVGVATWSDIEVIVVGIVFYSAGNGIAAVKRQPQQPVFAPKRRRAD